MGPEVFWARTTYDDVVRPSPKFAVCDSFANFCDSSMYSLRSIHWYRVAPEGSPSPRKCEEQLLLIDFKALSHNFFAHGRVAVGLEKVRSLGLKNLVGARDMGHRGYSISFYVL